MDRSVNLLEGKIFNKLLLLAAPLMATAFVQMAYSLTDLIWIGRLGTDPVAATGAAGFYTWIAMSLVLIPKIGVGVLAAQFYGDKRIDKVKNVIKNGFLLNILIIVAYFLLIQIFAESFIGIYNLEKSVHDMGVIYLRVISTGFIMTFFNPVLSSVYNSMGDSYSPFLKNVVGLVINIILDPLLIFGLGPIPALGIKGAALATVFAQLVVSLLFIRDIVKSKNIIYYGIKEGNIEFNLFNRIFKIGFPSGAQSVIHASISLILNKFMTEYGSKPIAVYSVGSMIESISWMTTEGFAVGITAFVGQNYGARKYERLKDIIKVSMATVSSIGILATVILIGFRNQLFYIFLPGDVEAIRMGAYYLLILGVSQFFMAIEIGGAGVFNGLSNTKTPAFISMFFNILRIPLARYLMKFYGFYGVWMAMSLSSILKGIVMNMSLYKEFKNIKSL